MRLNGRTRRDILGKIDNLESLLTNDNELVSEEVHVEGFRWHEEVLDL